MALAAAAGALAFTSPAAAQQGSQAAAKPVTRAELISRLDAGFAANDTNHDGALSVAELQVEQGKELERIKAALQTRLKSAFAQLDTNKDNQLSFAEFAASVPGVKATETPAQLLQKLDTNKDGKVNQAEFRAPNLATFDKADANHDGVVTPSELPKRR
jgi:Ca2+-binding EF-hand superfamily protein